MAKKHQWKTDIFSREKEYWRATLLRMSLLRLCFWVLPTQINYMVFYNESEKEKFIGYRNHAKMLSWKWDFWNADNIPKRTYGKVTFYLERHGRSSPPEVFFRKGVLQICSKFTGEHLCRSVISALVFSCKSYCIFVEHLFWRTPLEGCFCQDSQ